MANIVRLYRNEEPEWPNGAEEQGSTAALTGTRENQPKWEEFFPDSQYRNITGLCKVATLTEIQQQSYSLNPGRYPLCGCSRASGRRF